MRILRNSHTEISHGQQPSGCVENRFLMSGDNTKDMLLAKFELVLLLEPDN